MLQIEEINTQDHSPDQRWHLLVDWIFTNSWSTKKCLYTSDSIIKYL